MMIRTLLFMIPWLYAITCEAQTDMLTYMGSSGSETLYDVHQLSDGTFLVCGGSDNLDWVPQGTPLQTIGYQGNIPNSLGTGRFGFIMHLDESLGSILKVVHFPEGVVEDIRFMKFTSEPRAQTGQLYISCNTADTYANDGGYIIGRMNGNFVDAAPTALDWFRIVWAENYAKEAHPWDVTANGEVYYVSGASHGYDWSAMYKLNANGQRMVVPDWRTHWLLSGAEWRGTPASANPNGGSAAINYSGIVFKITGRCELRSWTQTEFDAMLPDGNGGLRKGTWPADVFFSGPCNPQAPSANSPGYTGYSPEACCPVWGASSVVVDRRNGNMYLGMNFKSYFNPEETPDFEPAVIAFSPSGQLRWWSRLYHEITPDGDTVGSIPDQYVDALAIDYAQDMLVVGGRTHGNNVENFWEGNTVAAMPGAYGFQNRFTGTNGNIHESWLGRLALTDGTLLGSTYVAELAEGTGGLGTPHPHPNLDGWPDPNTGWPDLNTTRIAKNAVDVTADGSVLLAALGRRTLTTANAYQKNVNPYFGGAGCWNSFVRMYDPPLQVPRYSSLIVGQWDTLTQAGGGNTELFAVHKTAYGLVCVGKHIADANGAPLGNAIPTANVPAWGENAPMGQSGVLAYLRPNGLFNADDGPLLTGLLGHQEADIRVYPNPFKENLHVLTPEASNFQFTLFDIVGRPILEGDGSSGQLLNMNVPCGMYLLQVQTPQRLYFHRLVRD